MDKFDKAMEAHPSKSKAIGRREKRYKKAMITLKLKDNEVIYLLERDLIDKINLINRQLLDSASMTQHQRDLLLREKKCWLWFVEVFPDARATMETINNYLETL